MAKPLNVAERKVWDAINELKRVPDKVAKKMARELSKGGTIESIVSKYEGEMSKLPKGVVSINPKQAEFMAYSSFHLYQAAVGRVVDTGGTNWRQEEYYMYWMLDDALGYDPWDNLPAYSGSDLTDQQVGGIQIKSEGDFFRIAYALATAKRELKKTNFSEGKINTITNHINDVWLNSNQFTVAGMKSNLGTRARFMAKHQEISQAKWYVIFFKTTGGYAGGYQAISFPAEKLGEFGRVYQNSLNPVKETTARGKKLDLAKLQIKNLGSAVWMDTLTLGNAIHYLDAKAFYKTRQNEYSSSEIISYNKRFRAEDGYTHIQNTYFAPIKYRT